MGLRVTDKQSRNGVFFAIAAYTMWGVAPIYFKWLQAVSALEILMHRIFWSALLIIVLVAVSRQWSKVKHALQNRRTLRVLLVSGLLLACNWFLFIWAINSNRLLDASLGYYINPLINVLLGYLFLAERLRPAQLLAVALACTGVLILLVAHGQLPWIALTLASTFGLYGLLRKQLPVDSIPGLLIETLLMLPFVLAYSFFASQVASNLPAYSWQVVVLLVGAGVVTTAPLLCFTAAARRLRYSTLGFFQYIGPSMMFVLATFYYDEPLQVERLITFAFVWLALIIFSWDSWRQFRSQR